MSNNKISQPTSAENLARIEAFFSRVQTLFLNLHARWQDEKEYEDIQDYGERLRKELPEGLKFERMTKKPFGFAFSIGDAEYHITCSGGRRVTYGWQRTK